MLLGDARLETKSGITNRGRNSLIALRKLGSAPAYPPSVIRPTPPSSQMPCISGSMECCAIDSTVPRRSRFVTGVRTNQSLLTSRQQAGETEMVAVPYWLSARGSFPNSREFDAECERKEIKSACGS
jgi:hypothetical protein